MLAVVYISCDEVNQNHARILGSSWGVQVSVARPHAWPKEWVPPIIICDFDSVPESEKARSLEALYESAERSQIVVHSYNFTEEEALALQARGCIIRRCLDAKLFKELQYVAAA